MKLYLGTILLAVTPVWMNGQVIPHIAVGGSYTTEFVILNPTSAAGSISVSFFGDSGRPMAVRLPDLNATSSGFRNTSVPAGGSLVVVAADPGGPAQSGSAVVNASSGLIVQARFRSKAADGNFYEAAVPLTQGGTRFGVPFDATTFTETGWQIYTGLAITNLDSARSATIACTAKNDSGAMIANAVNVPALAPLGHWAGYDFPSLVGKRGLLDCASNTTVAAIGLRFLGTSAFSSLTVAVLPTTGGNSTSTAGGTSQCPAASLIGNWSGEVMPSLSQVVDVSFRFNSDGTYAYQAGEGNAVWISHSGRYQIGSGADARWTCLVSLAPDPATVNVAGPALLLVLQSRDLPDDQARTFLYKFFPTSTHLMMAGTWTDWRNDIGAFGLDRQ
jgi:hypothetical protein